MEDDCGAAVGEAELNIRGSWTLYMGQALGPTHLVLCLSLLHLPQITGLDLEPNVLLQWEQEEVATFADMELV